MDFSSETSDSVPGLDLGEKNTIEAGRRRNLLVLVNVAGVSRG